MNIVRSFLSGSYKIAVLSSALFCFDLCYAQTQKLDSLLQVIQQHPQKDTTRVRMIMDYVVEAANENTSQLLPLLGEVIDISKTQNYKRGIQTGYQTAQLYYSDRGDFSKALLYADSTFEALEGDTAKKARMITAYVHHNVGGDYIKMGDYDQALFHFTQAAVLLEQYQPEMLSSVYSGIAEVYERMLQSEKAIEYDLKAIASAEKYGNKTAIVRRKLNYITRMVNQQKFDQVDALLNEIEPMLNETGGSWSWFLFHQSKGYLFRHRKNYNETISHLSKAKEYAQNSDDKYQFLSILDPLAKTLMEAGRHGEAKAYIDIQINKGQEYQMKFSRLNGYSNMAEWAAGSGDYKTANEFLIRKLALADSITSEETKDKIAKMETRFQVEAKDKEIKMLNDEKQLQLLLIRQKNILNYILIGGGAALVVILLLGYRNHTNSQKLQLRRITELETEKQLTATEAVLKGEEQERARLAKDLHDGLGGMLSGIKHSFSSMKGNMIMTPENRQAFERSMDMLDSSIKEMRRVAHNMMPEALVKFGLDTALRDFCNSIHQSGILSVSYQSIGLENASINNTVAITTFRIVQELLNNILKHASAKTAIVQITLNAGTLLATIEDDGKGFDMAELASGKGMGWHNIQNRVEFLKGKLDINSQPNVGTSILIELPYRS